MKYIKTIEGYKGDTWRTKYNYKNDPTLYDNTRESLLKYRFKIGDFVMTSNFTKEPDIFEITAIDPTDELAPYRLCSIDDDQLGTWSHDKHLTLVEEHEVAARKYNI